MQFFYSFLFFYSFFLFLFLSQIFGFKRLVNFSKKNCIYFEFYTKTEKKSKFVFIVVIVQKFCDPLQTLVQHPIILPILLKKLIMVFFFFKFYTKQSVATTIMLCQAHFHTHFIWYWCGLCRWPKCEPITK